MKATLADYEISVVIETAIIDYYPYEEQAEGAAFYDDEKDEE